MYNLFASQVVDISQGYTYIDEAGRSTQIVGFRYTGVMPEPLDQQIDINNRQMLRRRWQEDFPQGVYVTYWSKGNATEPLSSSFPSLKAHDADIPLGFVYDISRKSMKPITMAEYL